MAKTDIWMPLYIGDYLADTMHLTCEQHGAYMLLLMAYWRKGGALPSSDASLSAICRLSIDAWSMHKAVLMQFFDTSSGTEWVHHRAEKEILSATEKKEKSKAKAKKAAEARWNKEEECLEHASSNAQALLEQCPSPSPSPSPSPEQSDTPKSGKEIPACPHNKIKDIYNRVLPELAQVRLLTDQRKKLLTARWKLDPDFQSLEWWEKYFNHVRRSDFLMGRKTNWQADFDFLIKSSSFVKVLEGSYHGESNGSN